MGAGNRSGKTAVNRRFSYGFYYMGEQQHQMITIMTNSIKQIIFFTCSTTTTICNAINKIKTNCNHYDDDIQQLRNQAKSSFSKHINSLEQLVHKQNETLNKASGAFPTEDRLRSISSLPNLAKVFEKIIAERIEKWCNDQGIYVDEQSGFITNRQLQTRILALLEDLKLTVAALNRPALTIFIDILTAFDRMWYPALMKSLEKLNMPLELRK
ncbi:unnamed protein product [Rotaria sp. Silwood2]|nr:unnamed protein product [Rotaria sp. Silwood2]